MKIEKVEREREVQWPWLGVKNLQERVREKEREIVIQGWEREREREENEAKDSSSEKERDGGWMTFKNQRCLIPGNGMEGDRKRLRDRRRRRETEWVRRRDPNWSSSPSLVLSQKCQWPNGKLIRRNFQPLWHLRRERYLMNVEEECVCVREKETVCCGCAKTRKRKIER